MENLAPSTCSQTWLMGRRDLGDLEPLGAISPILCPVPSMPLHPKTCIDLLWLPCLNPGHFYLSLQKLPFTTRLPKLVAQSWVGTPRRQVLLLWKSDHGLSLCAQVFPRIVNSLSQPKEGRVSRLHLYHFSQPHSMCLKSVPMHRRAGHIS